MILNEQLIEDMFQDQPQPDLPSNPREDISLNFTNTSRSDKLKKSPPKHTAADIATLAQNHLAKFQSWVDEQTQALRLEDLSTLVDSIEKAESEAVDQQDLMIIKGELFKHEEISSRECSQCRLKDKRIKQLEEFLHNQKELLAEKTRQLAFLNEKSIQSAVMDVRECLLGGVQNNSLKNQIRQLHIELNALKNQKITLQRTFLFNKTRNSDAYTLHKSKDLSAAKNSTNSSQINRNHETIVFIDPIESDVDEWLKFFEAQRNRFRLLCRKQAEERQKQMGRPFTKEEKQAFESEDRLAIMFASINDVLRALIRIREHTNAFQQTELVRSGLREKVRGEQAALREEVQRANCRLGKALKINQYLSREKRNLQEISHCLKQQRLKENNDRNTLNALLKAESLRSAELQQKIHDLEEAVRQANRVLIEKEEQLLYSIEQVKKLKRNGSGWQQLQNKCRLLEKKYAQKLKEYEFQRNSYIFKLKKQALQRRKYCNQVEQMKGLVRLYCRLSTRETPSQLQGQLTDSPLFYKIVPSYDPSQRIYQDLKRLVAGAFDGFSFTVINYGFSDSGKHSFLYSDQQNSSLVLRILREVYRVAQVEKDFKVKIDIQLSLSDISADRVVDLNEDMPKINAQCIQAVEQTLEMGMNRRKSRDRSHFILKVLLEVYSLKTNEKHQSRIILVDLADAERNNDPSKGISSLQKCLSAFANKQKLVPYRESKLTSALKEAFNQHCKIAVIFNLSSTMGKEQVRHTLNFAQGCKTGSEEMRRRSLSRKNM